MNTSESVKLFKILKNILKTLEKTEENTRRMLILMEVDADVPMEDLGGPGEELGEALEQLDTVIIPALGAEVLGDEERRPSNLENILKLTMANDDTPGIELVRAPQDPPREGVSGAKEVRK